MAPRQAGFTLIELSVVLVIIGLVVGGVLVGRDLVAASAVRAQISQLERYRSSVNSFRDKFGGIPGDLAITDAGRFGFTIPASCTGQRGGRDGNGLIAGYSGTQTLAALMGENLLFWMDLTTAGMIDYKAPAVISNICVTSLTSYTTSQYLPEGKLGFNTYLHVYETGGANWYLLCNIGAFTPAQARVFCTPNIPVRTAYELDRKADDGIPTTGTVRAVIINNSQTATTTPANAAADSASTCYNTDGPAYSVAYENGRNATCALSFRFH